MLEDALKKEIQTAYSSLLSAKGYKARACQKQMVADIANSIGNIEVDDEGQRITEENICVVEAGTGTGKTIAYAIAALPIAKALSKRLVISTATIALQEQIVYVDLPDIMQHSGLELSFALAKGRRRYLCLSKLDQVLQATQSGSQMLAFYDEQMIASDESHQVLFEAMLTELGRGQWDGDRDNWQDEIDNGAWLQVSTDHVQCTGRRCSHYDNCYFYKAREQIHRVDCIVTNHDLVMADMMMGGGAVLPAPEETIYIFDEGHHLPDKALNHFAGFLQVRSTQTWLEQIPGHLKQLTEQLGTIGGLPMALQQYADTAANLVQQLEQVLQLFGALRPQAEGKDDDLSYRFPGGQVEPAGREISEHLYQENKRLLNHLTLLFQAIEDDLGETDAGTKERLEYWLPVVAAMMSRTEAATSVWQAYKTQDVAGSPPTARWINFREADELLIQSSPITVDDLLYESLWSRCFGAVITSATLSMDGDFSRYRNKIGISEKNHFRALASPFNYAQQAVLNVPPMNVDPRNADAHSDAVVEMLPELLTAAKGGLVLFASWRQMYRISDGLPEGFMRKVLSQGNYAKSEILAQHKSQVDQGQQSIIFGLASFAEGIDLPGDYCDHVVIIKIPFAVPNDPVGATLSEWIESKGGNSFQEVMVPDAALRMVQACGRLLRTEQDTGYVSILDRRLLTQRYGNLLLNALPPFKKTFG
ncbi:MAG: ATP-dependent DNA helicase DinG [Pseudomonadales bacterium]|nr:ATP-dependent DNA helicase DinG [Pseudomonadales bacterium]